MSRRVLLVTVAAASAMAGTSIGLAAAQSIPGQTQVRATVLMQGGQRYDGHNLTYRLDRSDMTIVTNAGVQERIPVASVAFVEFMPGTPDLPPSALGTLGPTTQTLQKRDGSSERGRLIALGHVKPGDETTQYLVVFMPENGPEERLDWSLVSRVYFAPPSTSVATTAVPQSGATVTVPANQQWTVTPFTVQQGETIRVTATGQIRVRNGSTTVAPAGQVFAREPGSPMPSVPVGSLLGRIGPAGQPFAIGSQTTIRMPAGGQLFLGVNDSQLQGNSGAYTVTLQRGR
jgi:hypothetical protein